jgi:hypothetical protein
MSHLPWSHQSRECIRCGKVGPRCMTDRGNWAHFRCLSSDEQKRRRAFQKAGMIPENHVGEEKP